MECLCLSEQTKRTEQMHAYSAWQLWQHGQLSAYLRVFTLSIAPLHTNDLKSHKVHCEQGVGAIKICSQYRALHGLVMTKSNPKKSIATK